MSYLRNHSIRALLAFVGLVSAIFAPWWVPLFIMFALSVRFRAWEAPFIGLFMDFLWGSGTVLGLPLFAFLGVVFVWLFEPLRSRFLP